MTNFHADFVMLHCTQSQFFFADLVMLKMSSHKID